MMRDGEMKWLSKNREQYANQWVLLRGNELVKSGEDAQALYDYAKEIGIRKPFISFIEPPGLPSCGW